MRYGEARNHFEKARINAADAVTIEMLDGLKHLSHAMEEGYTTLEQHIRDKNSGYAPNPVIPNKANRNAQKSKGAVGTSRLRPGCFRTEIPGRGRNPRLNT
jgi:hypothetical protein